MDDRQETLNLLIVSDLHLSEGQDPATGKYSPREDFFFDAEFGRFLEHHARLADEDPQYRERCWKLVLNGDTFCFLQVVARPRDELYAFEADLEGWELLPALAANVSSYAANGCLHLKVAYADDGADEAGAAVAPPEAMDLSGCSRLVGRMRLPSHAKEVRTTLRLRLAPNESATEEQWHHLEPGRWTDVVYDVSAMKPSDLRRVLGLEWRVASDVRQQATLCLDTVWTQPRLTEREERYGLGTRAEQAAWKLRYGAAGHPRFFEALAQFVSRGHRIVYVKGNHDVDVHWPQVQETFRDLIVQAAEACPDLAACDPAQIRERVEFCPWIYHEPGVVYIEHGNQYEPANFFRNFLNPVLSDAPQLLELPLGSFLVRYIFNAIEGIHPWADNMKPMTEYVRWALQSDLVNTLGIIVDNFGLALRAVWQTFRKRVVVPTVDRSVLADLAAEPTSAALGPEGLREIAEVSFGRVANWWRRLLRSLPVRALSLLLLAGAAYLFLSALLDMLRWASASVQWLAMLAKLAGASILFIARRWLQRTTSPQSDSNYLRDMAERISGILSRRGLAVPYLVFGHTHEADVSKLPKRPEVGFDQWYVNAGTWTQVFSEEERLLRDRKQFAFFRIVPGVDVGTRTLWQWDDDAGRPTPVVLQVTEAAHSLRHAKAA